MVSKSEPKVTKVANGIRRVASGLLGWAFPAWSPHSKDSYRDTPLVTAIIAIIVSLAVLAGILVSLAPWVLVSK